MTEENEDLAPNTEVDIPTPSFAPEGEAKELDAASADPVADATDNQDPTPAPTPVEGQAMERITLVQYNEMVAEKIIDGEAPAADGKIISLKNGTRVFLPA